MNEYSSEPAKFEISDEENILSRLSSLSFTKGSVVYDEAELIQYLENLANRPKPYPAVKVKMINPHAYTLYSEILAQRENKNEGKEL